MSEEESEPYSLSSQVRTLEERYNNCRMKNRELEKIVHGLQVEIAMEKMKNNMAVYQLKQQGVNIEELFSYTPPEIKKPQELEPKKKKLGKTFRTVKHIELTEEKPEEQEAKIEEFETKKEKIIQDNLFDVSVKEITANINTAFDELLKNRLYKKSLESIASQRLRLLGKYNVTEYTNLIKSHISRAENIFHQKKCDAKKATSLIFQTLSPLEQHLSMYSTYYTTQLEADEIQKIKLVLDVNTNFPRRYIPFSSADLFQRLYTYGLALFSIQDNLKRALVNPYHFHNLAYINGSNKLDTTDPYSFYILEKIESDGKRLWKMECRLDDISKTISTGIKTYCISMFRKFYFDMFNDNIFRPDYQSKYPLTHGECEQLIHNLVCLCRQRTFCDLCRNIVMEECKISITKLDSMNFHADDKLNKRQFAQEKDEITEWIGVVHQLFDDFADEDAKKFAESTWNDK